VKTSLRLRGCKIAALVTDGFEKVELTVPMRAYQLAGAQVDVVSLRRGRIRGVNLHEPAGKVRVDKTVRESNPSEYDALLLPGGLINPDLLRQSTEARAFVKHFDETNKPIASLCHGPWVLASAGLVKGRTLTSWPGIRDDLVNAGATWLNQEVVQDGNLLTSRGPQDLIPFVRASTDLFSRSGPILERGEQHSFSAPQANEPPESVMKVMKWSPRPSFRTAIALGALAILLISTKRKSA
jgi:protease I